MDRLNINLNDENIIKFEESQPEKRQDDAIAMSQIRVIQSRHTNQQKLLENQFKTDVRKNPQFYSGYNATQGGDQRVTNGYISEGQRIITKSGMIQQMPARKPKPEETPKKKQTPIQVPPHSGFLFIPDSDSFGAPDFNDFYLNILKWFCSSTKKTIYAFDSEFGYETSIDAPAIKYAIDKLKLKVKKIPFEMDYSPTNTDQSSLLLSELKKIDSLLFFPCFQMSYEDIKISSEFELFTSDVRLELNKIAKKYGLIISGEWAFKNNYLGNWYHINKDWLKVMKVDNRVDCYIDYQFYANGVVNWGLQTWDNQSNSFIFTYQQDGEAPNNENSDGIKKPDFIKAGKNYKKMIGTKFYSTRNSLFSMFQSIPDTEGIKTDEIAVIDSTDYLKTIIPEGLLPDSFYKPRCRVFYLSPNKINLDP